MTALEKHLQAELEKSKQKIATMQKIATSIGFYDFYFSNLKNFETEVKCFHYVNDLYFEFFGEYKYSSYNSFRKLKNKHLKS
jgi:hypothetical protein